MASRPDRSPIWALCVVLYELIGVARPSRTTTTCSAPRDHRGAPATLSRASRRRMRSFRAIIDHGVAEGATQRWTSMRDLGEALAQWLLALGVLDDATGTSLRRAWLRDPEGSGRLEISQVAALLPLQPGAQPQAGPAPGRVPLGPGFTAEGQSEPDLEAIAELNRGGDPVMLLERSQRRKGALIAVVLVALVLGAVEESCW